MRLSRIWRILQVEEGVIHRGRRPRWITPSEICRIHHILWKPNSIIALLFIIIFSSLKLVNLLAAITLFVKITQPRPQVFSVNSSIICSGLHFWRHWLNMTKFFANLVNSSWSWWIMVVVLTNQKRGNILNDNFGQQDHLLGFRFSWAVHSSVQLKSVQASPGSYILWNGEAVTKFPDLWVDDKSPGQMSWYYHSGFRLFWAKLFLTPRGFFKK